MNMDTKSCQADSSVGSEQGDSTPCEEGRKLVNGYCVKDWCEEDYLCPPNSKRLEFSGSELRQCFDSFGDCACLDGYSRNEDQKTCDSYDDSRETNPCNDGWKLDASG